MISTANTPNLPGWIDLGSPDPPASAEFYRKVFGWSLEPAGDPAQQAPPEGGQEQAGYAMFTRDGRIVGGLGGLDGPGAQSEWVVYVRVTDAAAAVKAGESLGGKTRVPPMQVGDAGSLAQLTDPTGAEFALWQPERFTGLGRVCEEDSLLWVQLHTTDPEASKRFYGELFGWKTEAFPMPEGATPYEVWTTNPGVGMDGFGGIVPNTPQLPAPKDMWIPYFMVADTDATVARAVEAGGTVLTPATDGPPGRLAELTDRFGAHFNLLKPAPMQ